MSSIFDRAERWGHWKDRNPVDAVTTPKIVMVRERKKLTSEQTLKLLIELPHEVRLIVETALFCTLRISEVMGLQWKHLDLGAGVLSVRQRYWRGDVDSPKTQGSTRDIPMGYLAQELRVLGSNTQREASDT
jgi:integrase